MKLALLDDYQNVALKLADWDRLRRRGVGIVAFDQPFGSIDDAARGLASFEIVQLLRERQPFPKALIDRLPALKLIVLTGARAPSLDTAAATARGIPVCNTKGGNSTASTAELAWALLMSAARDLARADRGMRAGGWHQGLRNMHILEGKRLGVLGLGKLGSRVAGYARAFGMEVVAWSQNLTEEKAKASGARLVSRDELLATSDFLSIHLVLSERTRGLLGAAELARLKPGAILVNTSRGPIVDERALVAALSDGTLAHAALDVFDIEPLPAGHPLTRLPNVTLAPHLGYVAEENYRVYHGETVANIEAWLDGKPINVTNPEALAGR